MKLRFLMLFLVGIFSIQLAAQKQTTPLHPPAGPNRPAEVPADYVITPFGYFHPSCVLILKTGEHVTSDGLLQHTDGSQEQVGCQYPHFGPSGAPALGPYDAKRTVVPQDQGPTTYPSITHSWIEASYVTTSTAYGKEVSTWTVPPLPLMHDGQTIYFFPGFEDYVKDVSILQPVIGSYNGGQWTMASWNCCLAGTADESTPINISPGDIIVGTTQMTCAAGTTNCSTWNVTTQDQTTTQSTELTATPNGGQTFDWAFGGVLEIYNVDQCLDYPPNASLNMTSLLYDSSMNLLSNLTWDNWLILSSSAQPQCNYSVTTTPTVTTLNYGKAGPGFGLGIVPAAGIAVNQGSSASGTITITDINGFSGSVQVTLSTPPSGITAQLTQGSAANTYVLTLSASSAAVLTGANTPASITLTASGSGVSTQTFPVNVIVNPPLTGGTGNFVSLVSAYNAYAFFNDSVGYPSLNATDSLDRSGDVYSANELSSPGISPMGLNFSGTQFSFGTPNLANAVYGTGANPVSLPNVPSNGLQILATGVNGAQKSQTVTVTYTDNTTQTFTQTFDDWSTGPSCAGSVCTAGESVAVTMPYTDTEYTYPRQDGIYYLYEYSFALNTSKTVKSLTLPSNRNVAVLAATLLGQQLTPVFGTMSFSPAATEPYGTNQAITITDTLTYTGGTKPTGAVSFTLNGVAYAASCTGTASPLSCTATVPATAVAVLPVAVYTVTAASVADSNYYAATASGTFTISKVTPTVRLTGSPAAAFLQSSVILTATVGSSTGTPSGTVVFSDGVTSIGTGNVSGGVATMTVSSLGSGTHSITAAYSGDSNFSAATSAAFVETVQDFTLTVGSNGSSQTVQPGATATFSFTISPTVGNTLPASVTLAASSLPSGFTAAFAPSSIAAGNGATTVTMTVQVPQSAMLEKNPASRRGIPMVALALLLLPFIAMAKSRKNFSQRSTFFVLLWVGICAATVLIGCGKGSSSSQTQMFTTTVTAASGALAHSTALTITVP
jgi:hypothetical protein